MNYHWKIKPDPEQDDFILLQKELNIHPVITKLLIQRGIKTYESAKSFFNPLSQDWHDPYLMADMNKAVFRLESAITLNEKIMVYGDYDVDGTTSVAMMFSFLLQYTKNIITYIPDRYKEGYGISETGIQLAYKEGCKLIIALDCGIKSIDKVTFAKNLGIDFIICDHHQPGDQIPEAVAVLDPKRKNCNYPFKELSGCGVGFKLIQAFHQKQGGQKEELIVYTDLLAVSISADIVNVTGENRLFLAQGLKQLNTWNRHGFRALLEESGGRVNQVYDVEKVVFQLAPRINAAGRIKHGLLAVNLLNADNLESARSLAFEVNKLNIQRRAYDETITEEALKQLETSKHTSSNVVFSPKWHKGVIGIAASRLIEKHYKPTVVLTQSGETLAGSARSVHGFNLYDALEACSDTLIQFGGHAFAAGMTMKPENLEAFRNRFEKVVSESITTEQRQPSLNIDSELDFSEINERFFRTLVRMGPFGPGNMAPVFISMGLNECGIKEVGRNGDHLRVCLANQHGVVLNGIAFKQGKKASELRESRVDVAYELQMNEFNGKSEIQLGVKDIRQSIL